MEKKRGWRRSSCALQGGFLHLPGWHSLPETWLSYWACVNRRRNWGLQKERSCVTSWREIGMGKAWILICYSLLDQIFQGTSYNDSVAKVWSLTQPQLSLQPEGTVVRSLVAVEVTILLAGEEPLVALYMEKVSPGTSRLWTLGTESWCAGSPLGRVGAKPWEVEKANQFVLVFLTLPSVP